jgi:hypothetical protein
MQQLVSPPGPTLRPNTLPDNKRRSRSQTIVFTAFTLFALSGLLIGFAVGAFIHSRQPGQPGIDNTGSTSGVVQGKTPQAAPTVDILALGGIGCPHLRGNTFNFIEIADGKTSNTVSIQAQINGAGVCQFTTEKPLHTPGITCKLWLIQRVPDRQILQFPKEGAKLSHVEMLSSPLTGTIQHTDFPEIQGLHFDSATLQTQLCNDQGQARWNYTVSPSVAPGEYDLVALTDWQGKSLDWSWFHITVKKAS